MFVYIKLCLSTLIWKPGLFSYESAQIAARRTSINKVYTHCQVGGNIVNWDPYRIQEGPYRQEERAYQNIYWVPLTIPK